VCVRLHTQVLSTVAFNAVVAVLLYIVLQKGPGGVLLFMEFKLWEAGLLVSLHA
jgi:hypothetical protein